MSQVTEVTVHKLGGSCLVDEKSFEKILAIIENYKKGGLILVASAMQGVTNQLIKFMQDCNTHAIKPEVVVKEIQDKHLKIASEIIKDAESLRLASSFILDLAAQLKEALTKIYDLCLINPQLTDQVVAFGERFSTSILYYYLKSKGYPVRFFQADNLIITDNNYTNALPKLDKTKKLIESQIVPVIKNNEIPVITGFLARSEEGFVTTLGRGGSDFTATLIAYSIVDAFKQIKVILWKDVDGLLTANPKYVPNAKLIKTISYSEAKELAFFGSKIIHPMCLIPLEERKIPLEIRNFSKPLNSDYTTFTTEKLVKKDIVKALTAKEDVALITVEGAAMVSLPGTAAKLFEILGNNNINIIMISQASSENNITLVVDRADKDKSEEVLKASDFFGRRWIKINAVNDVSLIAVVGAGMLNTPGIAARIFKAIAEKNINIIAIAQGSSEMNISMVIPRKDIAPALQAIHDEFKLSN
ncbi:MAG: aspartate kinase [Candidatus Odinarchaeum yellowstonii]|uniref:Aspartokinase n=1 Tax=Odinarchaeota yellowstonii (strain LCB_4) TaxID=1841599 RepID=A0AAF0IBK8_ODILC|nr:MAG: aspartate kinase [Candidatus Odinarchaeum yellowstonii]